MLDRVKSLAPVLLNRTAEVVLACMAALVIYWGALDQKVLGGPVHLKPINLPWEIGRVGDNRYLVKLIAKQRNCPIRVQHIYVQNGKTVTTPMPSSVSRTGIYKEASFPARPPENLKPGKAVFYVVVKYSCNPMFDQTYVSNAVEVELRCPIGTSFSQREKTCLERQR